MTIKADSHVHTTFSHDGKATLDDVVAASLKAGASFVTLTEHLDYDLLYGKCRAPFKWDMLNLDAYYNGYLSAKKALELSQNSTLNLGFGIEAAFSDRGTASEEYAKIIAQYPFDLIINSTHCVSGKDAYFFNYFMFKSKRRAYGDYLDAVLKSLDAPYPYDVVAHIGYITHAAPYKDVALRYADFPDKIDAILNGIIDRGKTLEVNFHHAMAPPEDILTRYYQLGGRDICYGGDSHRGEVCANFDRFQAVAKKIGFAHHTVYRARKPQYLPL